MKHKVLIPLITVLCMTGAAQQAPSRTADTEASKASARKMEQDAKTDPEFQRQRRQFEALVRELDNDPSLRAQRAKMQNDLKVAEGSPEIQLQKSKMDAELRQAEQSPERAEHMKRQQRDIEKIRETAPKKAAQ